MARESHVACVILFIGNVDSLPSLQLETEMTNCLEFLRHVYGIFGFTFSLKLSTRPEKFLGEIEVWNVAEKVCTFVRVCASCTAV